MKIEFPRNVVVDTDNIPQDFEEQIDWVGCGYADESKEEAINGN